MGSADWLLKEALPLADMAIMLVSAMGLLYGTTNVASQADWLRQRGIGAGLLPEVAVGRSGYFSLLAWVWTAQHRLLADLSMTRAVMWARICSVAFPISITLLGVLGKFQ